MVAQDIMDKARHYENIEAEITRRVNDRIKQLTQKKRNSYVDTPLEMGQWTCDPDCQYDYPDISKDEYLGNIDRNDYMKLREEDELVGLLLHFPRLFAEIAPLFIRDRKTALTLSNSKFALARRLLSEDTVNIKRTEQTGEKIPFSEKLRSSFRRKSGQYPA